MESRFVLAVVLVILASLADLVGGYLALSRMKTTRNSVLYATGLAAGFIVAAALLDRVPEAVREGDHAVWLLLGFLAIYLVENLFSTHAHDHGPEVEDPRAHEAGHGHSLVSEFQPEECHIASSAANAALVGLLLHTLFDGIAIAAGFTNSMHTGMVMFLAVIFHKFPEGFSVAALMLAAGRSRKFALMSSGLLGLATLVGGLLALCMSISDPRWSHVLLALATGTFLYIGCSDMIPATNHRHDRNVQGLVVLGMVLFAASSYLLSMVGLKV